MKLSYRGVQYNQEIEKPSTLTAITSDKEIIYRGNFCKAKINPKFPWIKYIKQLFYKSESKPIFDPITFWYNHKREFIEDCWFSGDVETLNRMWNLTLQIEQANALVSKQKTKLKYRGVAYYH